MTRYEKIQSMSIDAMALMFHTMLKETERKIINKLIDANIPFDYYELADEAQIAIHKQWLEQEVDTP